MDINNEKVSEGVSEGVKQSINNIMEEKQNQLINQDEINKQKAREEYERMEGILKSIEDKSKENVGYLLHPDRYEDETTEVYKIRRRVSNNFSKHRKRGTTFFESSVVEPRVIEEEQEDGTKKSRVEIHTTTKTFINPDRKNIKKRKENKKLR